MSLLKKIQEYGYQDWLTLATAVKNAGLGTTSSGYIYPRAIKYWFEYSLGMSKNEAEEVFQALVHMGYLVPNGNGNIYQ